MRTYSELITLEWDILSWLIARCSIIIILKVYIYASVWFELIFFSFPLPFYHCSATSRELQSIVNQAWIVPVRPSGLWTRAAEWVLVLSLLHEDVMACKRFPHYSCSAWGISCYRFPSQKGQWLGALKLSLMLVWTNCSTNNRVTGDLTLMSHYKVLVSVCPCGLWINFMLI